MRNWKRLFYYLFINILVSTCTVVTVLVLWDRARSGSRLMEQVPPLSGNPAVVQGSALQSTAGTPGPTSPATLAPAGTPVSPSEIQPTEAESGALEYVVQAGDVLGEIAVRFDVTVAEIVEANNLEDPDNLDVGQVLIIPGGTEPQPDETEPPPDEGPSESPTAEATQPPATGEPPIPGSGQVLIDSVVGVGDLATERVLLKRATGAGGGELSLEGWQLEDGDGNTFIFPQLTLFEAGAVNLYTKSGQNTVIALYWGLDEAVWEPGETVTLLDQDGKVHATYIIP
jgi:LysM repeat protein